MVFATDWPVTPIDPFPTIEAALTRPALGPGVRDERQTLDETLAAYTRDGAYAEFMEHRKGMLRPGMLADCVVLDCRLDEADPASIGAAKPRLTLCGGKVTFCAA